PAPGRARRFRSPQARQRADWERRDRRTWVTTELLVLHRVQRRRNMGHALTRASPWATNREATDRGASVARGGCTASLKSDTSADVSVQLVCADSPRTGRSRYLRTLSDQAVRDAQRA